MYIDYWVILTALLLLINSVLLGSFLVTRKSAMLADAISHAVLPGIVIGFMLTGTRASIIMLPFSALSGIVAAYLINAIISKMKIQADASIGLVFTFMFAVGIILISRYTANTDLDQECVLFGDIIFVSLDFLPGSGLFTVIPRAIWLLSGILVLNCLYLVLFKNELIADSFDNNHSAVSFKTGLLRFFFYLLVSLTVVIGFEIVGVILMVSIMVISGTIGLLLGRSVFGSILYALIIGFPVVVLGYLTAIYTNTSVSGMMATLLGLALILILGMQQLGQSINRQKNSVRN